MTPEQQVQEIVRRVQAGELSTTDALNGIVVILQQAGVEGTLEQIQRFAQEAFDRVTTSLTPTTTTPPTTAPAASEPAPALKIQKAPTTATDSATTTPVAESPVSIVDIVASFEAGQLSLSQLEGLLLEAGLSPATIAGLDPFTKTAGFGSQQEIATGDAPQSLATQSTLAGLTLDEARRERETGQGARRDVFSEFLATAPQFQNVNALVSRSLQNRFAPAEQSFLLQNQDPANTFFNFLQQGQPTLSPTAAAGQIANIAGFRDIPFEQRTVGQNFRLDPLESNRGAFEAALNTFLPGVTSAFRPAVQAQAQNVFDRFQGTNPSRSFLDFLGQRGGNIFGAVGSSGNPFQAFAR